MATHKRLVLMRHAKSDWGGNGDDFSRSLADRGVREARQMGSWLAEQGYLPEAVLSSPSQRTSQTLVLVGEGAGVDLGARTTWLDELYLASLATLLSVLRRQGAQSSLMVLGHNPGMEELLAYLVDDDAMLDRYAKSFPTAAVYVLELGDKWSDIRANGARVLTHQRPKMFSM